MAVFGDDSAITTARRRLETLAGVELPHLFGPALADCPDPQRAVINLERWLKSTSNAAAYLHQLEEMPMLARLVALLMGSSQPLADALIQNPELATLVADPNQLGLMPSMAAIREEGARLLALASGYTHALDRLRFLRQRWMLPIVVNDLAGLWEQPVVWRALSDLADALIHLTVDAVWQEYAGQKGIHRSCPVAVIAFGKLGGHELNYSSDVDLVYIHEDGLDEAMERHVARFAEMLNRALADRMGRGSLYRVDLRLRPFGGAGALVQSMRAVEAYYRSYALTWEAQALIRTRPVVATPEMEARWRALRLEHAFRPKVSQATVEEVVAMRRKVEEHADLEDLKRGPGGIRDVEFLVQVLQMVHGHSQPTVQTAPTLDALDALADANLLDAGTVVSLEAGYTFLRKLEHRCQLGGDQQTHRIPDDADARRRLAHLMGFDRFEDLLHTLDAHRSLIRSIYSKLLDPADSHAEPRLQVLHALGPLAPDAARWFESLPERDAFYYSLAENRDSLGRVRTLLETAPQLVRSLSQSLSLTEAVLAGEIEEPFDPAARMESLPANAPLERVATGFTNAWTTLAIQWTLDPTTELGPRLTALCDGLVRHAMHRLYADLDVIALGSFGRGDLGLESDLDVLFLVSEEPKHPEAELQAQQLMSFLGAIKRHGAPIGLDLRLRPEGGAGLLARTYRGFVAYELGPMEMWERFALGEARQVSGNPEALRLVQHAAYAWPLTPERLDELLKMKRRIETERVKPQHLKRDVKLGYGGLSDIEWFTHLHEMRFPTATAAGTETAVEERLRILNRARLLNALELNTLLEARAHLLTVRERLALLGFTAHIVPENPDKLDRLAQVCGFREGNQFLAHHLEVRETVRAIYTEGIQRLRA